MANLYWDELQEAQKKLERTKLQLDDTGIKCLKEAARALQEQNIKNQAYINRLSSEPLTLTNPVPKPGRPMGSKTKDKEVIIQETVDRLIDQVVKLLTRNNFDEDRLNDADITVDEKANYAFVTVTVGLPNGSIISVSERVKVANKTDKVSIKTPLMYDF